MASYAHNRTKTWKGRHQNKILQLEKLIQDMRLANPSIIQIGPGGIEEKHAHLFPQGDEEELSFRERKVNQLASMQETRARDDPASDLITFETAELYEMLQRNGGFSKFTVIEPNLKVRKAVERLNLPGVDVVEWDIENGFLRNDGRYLMATFVVGWKVLGYCSKPYSALASMARAAEKILSVDIPKGVVLDKGTFREMHKHIYLRTKPLFPLPEMKYDIAKALGEKS